MKKRVVFKLYLNIRTIYYVLRDIRRKFKEIFTGWHNYLYRDAAIEKLAKDRLKQCNDCAFFKYSACTRCGCPGAGKIRSPESYCIEGRWHSVKYLSNEIPPDVRMIIHNVPQKDTIIN